MDISNKERLRKELYERYLVSCDYDGIHDLNLINEAIAGIEHMWSYKTDNEVLGHSRTEAVAYLALLAAKEALEK